MSVVNCKVAYIRPKYNTLKEWMDDPQNVYIGRAGVVFVDKERFPKHVSHFANPYKIGKHGTREQVLQKYRVYILEKLEKEPSLKKEFESIRGKNLGCWCHPEPCHGDILLELM